MRRWWSLGRTELCSLAALAGAVLGTAVGAVLGWTDLGFASCLVGAVLLFLLALAASRGRPEPEVTAVPAIVLLVAIPVVGLVYLVGQRLGITTGFTAAGFTLIMSGIVLAQIIGRMVTDVVGGQAREAATPDRQS